MLSRGNRPPARTEGCSIADTNNRSRGSLRPAISKRGCEREHVGFGRATRESDVFGIGAKQLSDLLARFLNQTTDSPALGVHGRCIACESQGGAHGGPRLLSEGGGGIPVEICALGQGLHQYLITDFPT